jgi:hypothetical protein
MPALRSRWRATPTLTGGAITSTQKAVDDKKNTFTSQTLTTSDIQNQASYSANSVGINIGTGFDPSGKLTPQGTGAGIGKDSGNANSTTAAAISGIAGNKEARTGDAQTGIQKIFDADKVQKDIDAQVQITQTFGREASKAVGDYADTQMKNALALKLQASQESDKDKRSALEQQAQDIEDKWGNQGTARLAAHTLIGGLTGGLGGAAGAAAGTLTAPAVAAALKNAGIDGTLAQAITAAASTAVGAAVGGTAGAAAAGNEVVNNFLKHDQAAKMKKEFEACSGKLGGCLDSEVKAIAQKYVAESNKNIDAVNSCIVKGDAACVTQLESQAATAGEVDSAIPIGYGAIANIFVGRQNNVNNYGSTKGSASLFGTDVQQAQEVAKFRQENCSGMSGAACDGLVQQAMDDRMTRVGILTVVGAVTPGVVSSLRGLRMPGSLTQQEQMLLAQAAKVSDAKFVTKGVAFSEDMLTSNPAVKSLYRDYERVFGGNADLAMEFTKRAVNSGVDTPIPKQVGPSDTFVRMVPTGGGVGMSSFYVSEAQYNLFVGKGMNAAQIADAMGLPASSFANGSAVGFQAYAVKPMPGQLTTVYQSQIAPVSQAGYTANGGATQYVVPELTKFSPPQAIPGGSFAPVPYSPTAQPPLTPLLIPAATGSAKK